MHRTARAFIVMALLTLTACGGSSDGDDAKVKALQDRVQQLEGDRSASPAPAQDSPARAVESPAAQPAESPAGALVDFTMPNVVGTNLQDAQNRVQEYGVFYSISHDLLGSRNQVLDSNWQVCNQSPRVGARVKGPASDYEGKIDFGVVKLSETCP